VRRRIMAFHNSRHIKLRYGRIILREGKTYYRWCFSDPPTARAFSNSLADRSTNLIVDYLRVWSVAEKGAESEQTERTRWDPKRGYAGPRFACLAAALHLSPSIAAKKGLKASTRRCMLLSVGPGRFPSFSTPCPTAPTMIYRLAKNIVWGDEAKPLVLIHELAALLYGLVEAAPGVHPA
jgi:hypothetical protein